MENLRPSYFICYWLSICVTLVKLDPYPLKVRLVNGPNPRAGRVEVYYNNTWGTVCDKLWKNLDAQVVCRILGFHTDRAMGKLHGFFGEGTGPIFLERVRCRGNETSLRQCAHRGWGVQDCKHSDDAGVVCPAPATDDCDMYSSLVYRTERYCFGFVNQAVSWQAAEKRCPLYGGLLAKMDERIVMNTTASAIANAFKIHKDVPAHVYIGFYKRSENAPVWLLDHSNVTIPDDNWGTEGDGVLVINNHGDSVNYTWILSPGTSELPYICQFDPRPIKVRLVNGPNPRAGRVEVYYFDTWMTVCDKHWDNREAQVVCRLLDFPTDRALAHRGAFFGEGTGPIFMNRVYCRGNETDLRQCSWLNRIASCKHSEDTSVVCPVPATDYCDVYSLVYRTERYCFALMNQSVSWKTAKERCTIAGAVLAKIDEHVLTNTTASAIANAFKIHKDLPAHVLVGFNKIPENTPVWLLDDSKVTIPDDDWGTEGDGVLVINNHGDSVNYTWILSPGTSELPYICQFDPHPIEVRLVNGPNPSAGRVEVYYFDAWGTVSGHLWNNFDAQVVCRMLGLPTDRAMARNGAFFGKGTGPIFLDRLKCRGNETSLRQCSRKGWGRSSRTHSDDAGVVCPAPATDDCDMYSSLVYRTERYCFALMNWPVSWGAAQMRCSIAGAVLAKMDDGTMTDTTGRAIADAFKIRKDVRTNVHVGFYKRSGNAPVWLLDGSKVTISGAYWGVEGDGLLSIDHQGDRVNYMWALYPNYIKLPYICQFDLHRLKVRLVNGPNLRAGRVEINYNNAWGTVCHRSWDNLDAQVVCRMLGFPTDRAMAHAHAFFGEGRGPILLDWVRCRGNETSLRQCAHRGWGVESCTHSDDAGVECPEPYVGTTPDFLGGTTTADPVGETTDVTVYETTAVSIYVISDTPLMFTTTSSTDGTTEGYVDTIRDYNLGGTTAISGEASSHEFKTEDKVDKTTTISVRTSTLTQRQKKPVPTKKYVAMTRESVYMDGQALFERRSAMVTTCARICTSDDRCVRFNHSRVTRECRIFSKDAEVSYTTKPDWTVWETFVVPK